LKRERLRKVCTGAQTRPNAAEIYGRRPRAPGGTEVDAKRPFKLSKRYTARRLNSWGEGKVKGPWLRAESANGP